MTEHVRKLMTGASEGVVVSPVASFRWCRIGVLPGEVGMFVDGKKNVLQQAWVDNKGDVHWRDVPIVDAE